MVRIVGYILIISFTASCSQDKSILNETMYDGPTISMDSIETRYSDEGKVRLVIRAPKELSFDNGNKEWPEGLFLEIYDNKTAALTTTFRSDRAFYYKEDDKYMGEGDVVVKNLETGDELSTEQLYWEPKEEKFYTEKYVIIKEGGGEMHTGEGLTASQDFTEYEIAKPSGSLPGQNL